MGFGDSIFCFLAVPFSFCADYFSVSACVHLHLCANTIQGVLACLERKEKRNLSVIGPVFEFGHVF